MHPARHADGLYRSASDSILLVEQVFAREEKLCEPVNRPCDREIYHLIASENESILIIIKLVSRKTQQERGHESFRPAVLNVENSLMARDLGYAKADQV